MKKIKPPSTFKLIFNSHQYVSEETANQLASVYSLLNKNVLEHYPEAKFITDSSKSMWMLNGWLHVIPHQNIKIIWLKRKLKPNVASFMKRGNKFVYSALSLVVNDSLIKALLRKNKFPFLQVDYDNFYNAFEHGMKNVSRFLQIEVPSQYINHSNHHVISGNRIKGTNSQQIILG